MRSPGLYPVFSFVLRRASKLPCFRSRWFGGAGTIPCFRGGHTGHTLFVAASAVLVLPSLPKPQTNHSQAATCSRLGPQFSVLSLCIIHREPSIFFSAVQILIDLSKSCTRISKATAERNESPFGSWGFQEAKGPKSTVAQQFDGRNAAGEPKVLMPSNQRFPSEYCQDPNRPDRCLLIIFRDIG